MIFSWKPVFKSTGMANERGELWMYSSLTTRMGHTTGICRGVWEESQLLLYYRAAVERGGSIIGSESRKKKGATGSELRKKSSWMGAEWARRGKESNEAQMEGQCNEDPGSIKACTVVFRGINPV